MEGSKLPSTPEPCHELDERHACEMPWDIAMCTRFPRPSTIVWEKSETGGQQESKLIKKSRNRQCLWLQDALSSCLHQTASSRVGRILLCNGHSIPPAVGSQLVHRMMATPHCLPMSPQSMVARILPQRTMWWASGWWGRHSSVLHLLLPHFPVVTLNLTVTSPSMI